MEAIWPTTTQAEMYNRNWYSHWLDFFGVSEDEFEFTYNHRINAEILKEILYSQFLWVGTTDENLWNPSLKLFEKKFEIQFEKTNFQET